MSRVRSGREQRPIRSRGRKHIKIRFPGSFHDANGGAIVGPSSVLRDAYGNSLRFLSCSPEKIEESFFWNTSMLKVSALCLAAADGDLFIASRTMIGISSNFCHRNPVSASTISLGPPESCTIGTHEADIASTIVIPKCSPTIMCRYTFDSPRML